MNSGVERQKVRTKHQTESRGAAVLARCGQGAPRACEGGH